MTGANFEMAKKAAVALIVVIGTGFIAIEARKILSPLIFACLFSILLLPVSIFFEKRLRFHRALASVASVVLLLLAVAAIIATAYWQMNNLIGDWDHFRQQFRVASHRFQVNLHDLIHITPERQKVFLHDAFSSRNSPMAGRVALWLSSTFLFGVLAFLFTFFLLMYRSHLRLFLLRNFSKGGQDRFAEILADIQKMVKGYMLGMLLEIVVVSTLCSVAFSLLGIPYAVLLGIMTGIFNVIPYIGIYSSMILSILVTLATIGSGMKLLIIPAVILPVHMIDSNIILPFLVGSRVRVNALVTFFGIVIGGWLWGISGIFLSIPSMAIAKIVFDHTRSLYNWGFLFGDKNVQFKGSSTNS